MNLLSTTASCLFTSLVIYTCSNAIDLPTTKIILGNSDSQRAEVYQVSFSCASDPCVARVISPYDLLWSSPKLAVTRITEVKRVVYNGADGVLVAQDTNVFVFAYPSGDVLFNRTLDSPGTSIHSGEVLPDGNVVVVVSTLNSIYILKPCRETVQLANCTLDTRESFIEANDTPVRYGHGVAFDRKRNKLIVLGYLEVQIFSYSPANNDNSSGAKLILEKSLPLDTYYISTDHNEDFFLADGGHDLFPIGGSEDEIFMTTGERVFILNAETHQIRKDNFFYYLNSQHGQMERVEVAFKSGVKSISRDPQNQFTLVHSAPWFKELYNLTSGEDNNYASISSNLVWSVAEGRCAVPDFDTSEDCKITFADPNVTFYKARLFDHPQFSYDVNRLKKN